MTGKIYFTRLLDLRGHWAIVRPSCIPAGRQAEGCGRRARFPATPTRRLGWAAEPKSPGCRLDGAKYMVEASRAGAFASIPLRGPLHQLVKPASPQHRALLLAG